jgi:RNA polymerase sigma-70 factor (ECF subfamily)
LQAAIAACHAESVSWAATDWSQILVLYDMLLRHEPAPVVQLNRAVALRYVVGPYEALREVDALRGALNCYHLWHAVRADMLSALGRRADAEAAAAFALALTRNPAEQSLLRTRLSTSPS